MQSSPPGFESRSGSKSLSAKTATETRAFWEHCADARAHHSLYDTSCLSHCQSVSFSRLPALTRVSAVWGFWSSPPSRGCSMIQPFCEVDAKVWAMRGRFLCLHVNVIFFLFQVFLSARCESPSTVGELCTLTLLLLQGGCSAPPSLWSLIFTLCLPEKKTVKKYYCQFSISVLKVPNYVKLALSVFSQTAGTGNQEIPHWYLSQVTYTTPPATCWFFLWELSSYCLLPNM